MTSRVNPRAIGVLLAMAVFTAYTAAQAQDGQRSTDRIIEQVSKHVYRFGSDGHFGAYILTSDGIIVVDGDQCTSGTTQWLKSELAKRHNVPVRYVILSHDHQTHICNTQLFSDTAVAIGHSNLRPHLIREKRVAAVPQITFDESIDLHLGGVRVKLLYFGPTHSDNLIQVHIPQDRVLVAIDTAQGKGLFPDLRDMEVDNMLKTLRALALLDEVDVVLSGHGEIRRNPKDFFMDTHRFIATLRERVLQHMVDGRSLAEIRQLVKMEDFRDYAGLEANLDPNIVTMYQYLYRYREPNDRLTGQEAVDCIENVKNCRTSDPKKK